jgi:glycosyltransferase involved in cell wall biosynthesis
LSVAAVLPARNEAATVAANVAAALACRYVSEVVVVDDGSTDATAAHASAAGARVVARGAPGDPGSKALAMEVGVAATTADAILFVDADCLGLTAAHLDAICAPVVERRAAMSMGMFDYGWLNPLVLRFPAITGERIVPRWVFEAVPPHKRQGYLIEIMLNEVVCEGRLPTTARVMRGVSHRTKREKMGRWPGYQATWRMFWDLWALWGVCRKRTYWFYLRGLTIES